MPQAAAPLMIAGSLLNVYEGFQAASQQKKLVRAQQAQADLEAQNQRLEQVRQARIARARSIQAAENQGAGGSSSETTAASGFNNQAASNIGYINSQQVVSNQITSAKVGLANAGALENLGNGLTNLGSVFGGHPKTFGG